MVEVEPLEHRLGLRLHRHAQAVEQDEREREHQGEQHDADGGRQAGIAVIQIAEDGGEGDEQSDELKEVHAGFIIPSRRAAPRERL